MPTLDELIESGDLDAIDGLHFRKSPEPLDSHSQLKQEEKSYQATLWYPISRTRKIEGLTITFTTRFVNDNPNAPIASLDYVTTSSTNKIALALKVRDASKTLPLLLAVKMFKLNNPLAHIPVYVTVPTTLNFSDLEEDLSDFEFICDHLCPAYKINGQQTKFGALYFMHEHNNTLRVFKNRDMQQPLAVAGKLFLSLYKTVLHCAESESGVEPTAVIEEIIEGTAPRLTS